MKSILRFIIIICLETGNCNSQTIASFICPDTVCVNQSFTIQNTSTGGSTYYWNFCSGNLSNTPSGINLGNQGNLNGPVYIALASNGNQYFSFITNHLDGTLTRNFYGNSYSNIPVSTNMGSLGILHYKQEGIQVKKDNNGNWYGFIVGGISNDIIRLNFGASLLNTPTAVNLGNPGNSLSYPHTIYTFFESGNWYSFVSNYDLSTLTRLDFGSNLSNTPTAVSFGNIGGMNGPTGFYPVKDNGIWFLFVVNRNNNSISRLEFGNSLINTPNGVNIGQINNLSTPRSITLIKDCGTVFGFVVNESLNSIVRLTFPNGLNNPPVSTDMGNIAGFDFPHHISDLIRANDTLFTFITNVDNHTISKVFFSGCTNSSIPSSSLQTPPSILYSNTGVYNISLVVNEGLPTQSNFCKQIVVINGPDVSISGDSIYCDGDSIRLAASSLTGVSYNWIGPNGFSSTNSNIVIPNANSNNTGDYSCFVTYGICSSTQKSIQVQVTNLPAINLGNDTSLCNGESIILSPGNGFSSYLWSNGSTLPYLTVDIPGLYSIVVTDGTCKSHDEIKIDECDPEIWVPNVFTPNGDGLNDEFYPVYSNIDDITLYIFNRWGNQLYEGKGIKAKWDGRYKGKLCPDGVYTYLIIYSQKRFASEAKELHGCVTILK